MTTPAQDWDAALTTHAGPLVDNLTALLTALRARNDAAPPGHLEVSGSQVFGELFAAAWREAGLVDAVTNGCARLSRDDGELYEAAQTWVRYTPQVITDDVLNPPA